MAHLRWLRRGPIPDAVGSITHMPRPQLNTFLYWRGIAHRHTDNPWLWWSYYLGHVEGLYIYYLGHPYNYYQGHVKVVSAKFWTFCYYFGFCFLSHQSWGSFPRIVFLSLCKKMCFWEIASFDLNSCKFVCVCVLASSPPRKGKPPRNLRPGITTQSGFHPRGGSSVFEVNAWGPGARPRVAG